MHIDLFIATSGKMVLTIARGIFIIKYNNTVVDLKLLR